MADDLEADEWWIEGTNDTTNANKRKLEDDKSDSEENEENQDIENKNEKPKKKRKKVQTKRSKEDKDVVNEHEKAKKKNKGKLSKKKADPKNITDSCTLWNAFLQSTKGKLSQMESDELKPENMDECFLNDTIEPHTSLDELSPFLIRVIPHWTKVMQSFKQHMKGSPALLILCSSARRSVEVSRAIKSFKQPSCKTAKLFAKHFKLEDQQTFLSKSCVHIGVGTPNRVSKLVSDYFLKLKKLKYVVFDWNYKDPKQRRMIDIPEVKKDIIGLLQQNFWPLFKDGKVKYALF